MRLDELNELEDEIDEEDERIFEAYRLYTVQCVINTSAATNQFPHQLMCITNILVIQ